MKASIGLSIALGLFIAVLTQAQGSGDPQKDAPKKESAKKEAPAKDAPKKEVTVGEFMRRKLELSQQAMDGIVNEDFDLIKKSAVELEKMGSQKEWKVIPGDDYTHLTAEFRRSAKSMAREAEKLNVDGSAIAFMQLTMSCVECHKFTRRTRMADASVVK